MVKDKNKPNKRTFGNLINSSFVSSSPASKKLAGSSVRSDEEGVVMALASAAEGDAKQSTADVQRNVQRNVGLGLQQGTVVNVVELEETKIDYIMSKLSKLDILDTILSDVNDLKQSLDFCHNSIDEIKAENRQMKHTITEIQTELAAAKKANHDNLELIHEQQWRSMRDNLLFHGIPENQEVNEDCVTLIQDFVCKELGLGDVSIARAHRIGGKADGKNRPIVAKFDLCKDRETVKFNAKKLAGKKFGITEQIPLAWHNQRKLLMPKFRLAKSLGHKAQFSKDKLYVNGQQVLPDKATA